VAFSGWRIATTQYPGRRSNMIRRSVAIVPGSVKSSLEMLRPSAMTHGPIGIGRHARINIMAVLLTGDEVTLGLCDHGGSDVLTGQRSWLLLRFP
jgi:hypothetical protein